MINVTLGAADTQKEKPFPKLMITSNVSYAKNRIVFFTEPMKGVCLQVGDLKKVEVGHYSDNWNMDAFTDYNEPITIQNA